MCGQITYLVANYNNGRYISDCLRSLQAQTNPAWHCLIGDDKSTDDSLTQIRPWLSDKIALRCNETNLGYTATLILLYRFHFHERYAGRRLTPVALTASGRALWRLLMGISNRS